MQKKVIALAVAGLVSAGAYAQSNVQIYGVVDYGYTYRTDILDSADGKAPNHAKSQGKIDAGQSAGNRLGFKGVEDIGNGLKAVFVLERGFNLDTGTDRNGFNRQAYVGLAGDWGTLAGGRIYTPYYNLLSSVDPFGDGTVGQYSNIKGDALDEAGVLFNPVRVNNTIAYISPTWSGLSFVAAYSNNALADDGFKTVEVTDATNNTTKNEIRYTNGGDNNVATIAANLTGDNYLLGLTYHRINLGSVIGGKAVDNVSLGGTYDFGMAKVAAFWSWDKLSFDAADSKDIDQNNFMLGATVPFGKQAVKASFNYSKGDSNAYGDAWQLALGYTYNLSKRTNFYAVYSFIDNDNEELNAQKEVTKAARKAVVGDSSNSGGVYQQAFQLGITHRF